MDISGANVASDFVIQVNKIRESTSSVSRQLNAHPLGGRDYEAFPLQEEALKVSVFPNFVYLKICFKS